MVISSSLFEQSQTLAEVVERLGNVALERILTHPLPGTATADDVIDHNATGCQRFELIDRMLVEKTPMSYLEEILVMQLALAIGQYLEQHPLGKLLTSQAMYRLAPSTVRLPDLSFCRNETLKRHFPGGKVERVPIAEFAPDLAVEVLSVSNTAAEMERKRRDFFTAGVQVLWIVDPATRTVTEWAAVFARGDVDRRTAPAWLLDFNSRLV